MAHSQPWLEALAEQHADGRTLFRESFDGTTSVDRKGVLESSFRFTEATADDPNVLGTVEITAAQGDVINKNIRFYSKKVYELAVGRAQSLIRDGIFLGECDHPWMGSLEGAACRWTKVWMEGVYVKATGVLLKTDKGQHIKALLDGGVGVQISTRGYGSYTVETRELEGVPVEVTIIGDDYAMEGIDFVLFASSPAGRVTKNESTPHPEDTVKTLEQLRAEHPALIVQLEAAAREGFIAQAEVDRLVLAAKEAAKTEGLAEGKQTALDSAEVKHALGVAKALESVGVKPTAPAADAAPSAEFKALEERIQLLANESATAKAAAEKAAVRVAVSAKVDEMLVGFAQADIVRPQLLQCESVEAVVTSFASAKAMVESAAARARVTGTPGTGVADVNSGAPFDALSESERTDFDDVNSTRRAANLDELSEAKYRTLRPKKS